MSINSLIFATDALAQFASPDSLSKSWSGEPGLWPLVKLLLLLALVLGLVWVSLTALKKVAGKGAGSLKGVEILGGLPLGPRRSLVFVKIAGKVHIIGATDQNLSLIGLIEDPVEVADMSQGGASGTMPQFKDILSKFTKSGSSSVPRGGSSDA